MISLTVSAFACGGGGSTSVDNSGGDQVNGGNTYVCTGLGTNNTTFVTIGSNKITVVLEGVSVQTGELQPGSTTFGQWSPTKGYLSSDDTLDVSAALMTSGSGEMDLNTANVGPHWVGDCHKATQTQLQADQCMSLVADVYPVDSDQQATIQKSGSKYTVTIDDPKAGPYVYSVSSRTSGLLCKLGTVRSVSCAAVVADATSRKAYDNGASSGSPFVEKVSDTEWSTGQLDEESGDQYFKVTTDGAGDHCHVVSIVDDTSNH
jgi:hypothetical protein